MQKIYYFLLLLLLIFLAACQPLVAGMPESATSESGELDRIDLGVGFVPNVQFAPFYVAQAKGFFAAEGLDVVLEYGFENDFITLTAQGERQFAIASGDQVILGRAQGLPLVYVMKWYERFPVGVMALAETGIDSPEALAQNSVGIPGMFGASFVAWKALVYATALEEETVQLQEIGFTQAEAISEEKVDAAVVYLANEPILLAEAGLAVNVIEISEFIDLVANGIVTNETMLAENPDLIRRLVKGSLQGLQYTIDNPDEAFEIVREFIPEMSDEDAPIQRLVLERSIDLWLTDQPGFSSSDAWAHSVDFMFAAGIIESAIEKVDALYTNEFVAP